MNSEQRRGKRILIVGATSKIAQEFIRARPDSYEIYGTNGRGVSDLLPADHQFRLDLSDSEHIKRFLVEVADITFDAVLFFAATYAHDPDQEDDYFVAYQKDLQINAASTVTIAKRLSFTDRSKLFVFGDAGLTHPKKGFTAYSISKFAIADICRMLAVELAPRTSTFCFRLGPTLKQDITPNDEYYRRGLIQVDSPVDGLVHLIQFLIHEPNFNATGCVIDYDGGTYIKRPSSS